MFCCFVLPEKGEKNIGLLACAARHFSLERLDKFLINSVNSLNLVSQTGQT